jgi:hypothetical protein
MATRSIVTSQPDVECDVCERRLLRGEQPDVFLAAGRRHLVCELCAPRAVQEGWMRETGGQPPSEPAASQRRGRNLFDRLRLLTRPPRGAAGASPRSPSVASARSPSVASAQAPYAPLDADTPAAATAWPDGERVALAEGPDAIEAIAMEAPGTGAAAGDDAAAGEEGLALGGAEPLELAAGMHLSELQIALEAFNASEHPRRVAGVARSLGAPVVSVRRSEHARSVVTIVIAWELCWYRYRVDLDDSPPEARALAQGTELSELMRGELLGNGRAEESGTLLLADAHAAAR